MPPASRTFDCEDGTAVYVLPAAAGASPDPPVRATQLPGPAAASAVLPSAPPSEEKKKKKSNKGFLRGRPYLVEGACFLFFGALAAYAGIGANWVLTGYCAVMGLAFAVLSLGGAMPIFGM